MTDIFPSVSGGVGRQICGMMKPSLGSSNGVTPVQRRKATSYKKEERNTRNVRDIINHFFFMTDTTVFFFSSLSVYEYEESWPAGLQDKTCLVLFYFVFCFSETADQPSSCSASQSSNYKLLCFVSLLNVKYTHPIAKQIKQRSPISSLRCVACVRLIRIIRTFFLCRQFYFPS